MILWISPASGTSCSCSPTTATTTIIATTAGIAGTLGALLGAVLGVVWKIRNSPYALNAKRSHSLPLEHVPSTAVQDLGNAAMGSDVIYEENELYGTIH